MTTIKRFSSAPFSIPSSTAWYIADLGEFKGKQDLYARRSPQRLKALREHAVIESAVSSNRIEGVTIDPGRVREVLSALKPLFRDRDEEEVRGYRDALTLIHQNPAKLPISEDTILLFHNIIERYPDGRERLRFRTVPAKKTSENVRLLVKDWNECMREKRVHPLIAMAFFNLDFLCIHPFRDGNGRVSRLLPNPGAAKQ